MARTSRDFETRAAQVRSFEGEIKRGETSLRRALRDAAMVGACEERDRTLKILREHFSHAQCRILETLICELSILEVLGYEKKQE